MLSWMYLSSDELSLSLSWAKLVRSCVDFGHVTFLPEEFSIPWIFVLPRFVGLFWLDQLTVTPHGSKNVLYGSRRDVSEIEKYINLKTKNYFNTQMILLRHNDYFNFPLNWVMLSFPELRYVMLSFTELRYAESSLVEHIQMSWLNYAEFSWM